MSNHNEDTDKRDQKPPRPGYSVLDNTAKLANPEGDYWTFRKQLESAFLELDFKSRKFSHAKEPETRLADSLWLTWHRKNSYEQTDKAVDNIDVRIVFNSSETTVLINCYGTNDRGCIRTYRTDKLELVIPADENDTTELFHHLHHFLTKPKQKDFSNAPE